VKERNPSKKKEEKKTPATLERNGADRLAGASHGKRKEKTEEETRLGAGDHPHLLPQAPSEGGTALGKNPQQI